ncbi:MAG TPA: 5'-nucleotidase C-terminal domain-containing protein, partial [Longimicrobiales bacterium]|nr:5'-nucleotidase C-terminal domain-containing protein [Longimicrobiales bacterium]
MTLNNRTRAAATRPLALVAVLLAGCASAPLPEPAPVPVPPPVVVAADTMSLVMLGTTDLHGYIWNHDYYTGRETRYGLALLKPLVDSIRAARPGRTLLFDSGDLLQGNPLPRYERGSDTEPNPVIRAMNFMGYDAAAIGNHEFNYGLPNLARAISQARFPFVTANIYDAGATTHAYEPYTLIPVATPFGDTLTVGVTGNTPPGVHVWDRDNVTGVLDIRDVVTSVGSVVRTMRERGADIVVVLSHGGLEGTSYDTLTTGLPVENAAAELARRAPGIDVIFMGHTHRELADTTINGVLLTQAKNWATSLAVATLTAQRASDGSWRAVRKRGEILRPRGAPDRALLDTVRWEHERVVAHINARIGRTAEAMPAREGRVRDVAVIDFINEVQRRVSGAQLSSTAAFSIAAGLPAGDLAIADVAALYPYDNTLKAIRITGAQLRAYLEKAAEYYNGWPQQPGRAVTDTAVPGYNFDIVSGADYTIDISRPVGQRVTELRYEGAPVRDDQSFTLALNNYRQSGGGGYGMIAGAEVVYDRQEDIRELLIEEVRRRGEIRAADYFRQSWQLVPREAVDAALREQVTRDVAPAQASTPAATRKRLRVLSTNDFHGHLELQTPSWAQGRGVGGAAVLTRYFQLEAEGFDGPTIILDGGDVMQGTPVSNLARGRPTVDYFNMARYRGAALGNHE